MAFLNVSFEDLRHVPKWLLSLAAVAAIMIVMFQMMRGEAFVCPNGAIFAKSCNLTEFPNDAIVAFDREEGCPEGWEKYSDGSGRFIVGVGRHTEHDLYGNKVKKLKFKEKEGHRTHRLSAEEMPPHHHMYEFSSGERSPGHPDKTPEEFGVKDKKEKTTEAGGKKPHNNMPPYIALHFCKR